MHQTNNSFKPFIDQIHKFVDEPHFADYADPFLYNERLTMVKYIVSGTLDYFWSPDDSWSFFDQLKGTNYMRLLPNSGIPILINLNIKFE